MNLGNIPSLLLHALRVMHIKCVVRGFFDCVFAVTQLYFAILSDDIGSMRIKDLFK